MPSYFIGKSCIEYKLEKRENLTRRYIKVTPDLVLVTVRIDDSQSSIDAFLKRKEQWLFNSVRQVGNSNSRRNTVHTLSSGVKIPYRGRRFTLKITRKNVPFVQVEYRNGFHVQIPKSTSYEEQEGMVQDALNLWLRKQIRRDATALVKKYAESYGLNPKGVRIKDQKHMWGSCGKDRIVNLNWHLIFAPKSVLEYVVVHELCHLKFRTHDGEFWKFLKLVLPDYKKAKEWLERNESFIGYEIKS